MKKIRSIAQLKSEKQRIQLEKLMLEQKIHSDWRELKNGLRPSNLVESTMQSFFRKSDDEASQAVQFFKKAAVVVVSILINRLIEKIYQKS